MHVVRVVFITTANADSLRIHIATRKIFTGLKIEAREFVNYSLVSFTGLLLGLCAKWALNVNYLVFAARKPT